jgi:hypothetical protein
MKQTLLVFIASLLFFYAYTDFSVTEKLFVTIAALFMLFALTMAFDRNNPYLAKMMEKMKKLF